MLTDHDAQSVADQFGVAPAQVRRDHLISHLLGALSKHAGDRILFFGGTALSRTVIPTGRLSEDIDLIALDNRQRTAEDLHRVLVTELRREYPGATWQPPLTTVHDTQPAILSTRTEPPCASNYSAAQGIRSGQPSAAR
ncbi:nucleotidyl transferase AbiEii/AbiGii toxin family protein [Nocardia huaxiensis]|uniref:nucleotidyl transferase AbiEii/AbiGii toxin family protein n=1 Tax=Nocardia huaxiensis TaxID=2755382 RepID=UPI0023E77BCF|nr:nucleotidyl transferase AbiEii/AbiGii toxin family protein [Nocardia huaxiensis]